MKVKAQKKEMKKNGKTNNNECVEEVRRIVKD